MDQTTSVHPSPLRSIFVTFAAYTVLKSYKFLEMNQFFSFFNLNLLKSVDK